MAKNPLNDIVNDIVSQAREMRKEAKKTRTIPFGSETVTPEQARIRLEKMPPKQRGEFIKQVGLEETLKLLRGKNGS